MPDIWEARLRSPIHSIRLRDRQTAMVVGDQIHDGSRHLNLRSEDDASFFVPAWMTQEEASAVKIVDAPCPSLGFLSCVRS
jgi:hypothetical protein